eukprot:GHVU01226950.1.p1 GENE.GHVU01226950.1~~GHVU01226950.1.p1  ORF type:complete len:1110 (+),score=174.53 GHVU01226950.1:466-3330(+)
MMPACFGGKGRSALTPVGGSDAAMKTPANAAAGARGDEAAGSGVALGPSRPPVVRGGPPPSGSGWRGTPSGGRIANESPSSSNLGRPPPLGKKKQNMLLRGILLNSATMVAAAIRGGGGGGGGGGGRGRTSRQNSSERGSGNGTGCDEDPNAPIQVLTSSGGPPTQRRYERAFPLLLAVRNCSATVVQRLLEGGASVATRDEAGRTALHWLLAVPDIDILGAQARKQPCRSSDDGRSCNNATMCTQEGQSFQQASREEGSTAAGYCSQGNTARGTSLAAARSGAACGLDAGQASNDYCRSFPCPDRSGMSGGDSGCIGGTGPRDVSSSGNGMAADVGVTTNAATSTTAARAALRCLRVPSFGSSECASPPTSAANLRAIGSIGTAAAQQQVQQQGCIIDTVSRGSQSRGLAEAGSSISRGSVSSSDLPIPSSGGRTGETVEPFPATSLSSSSSAVIVSTAPGVGAAGAGDSAGQTAVSAAAGPPHSVPVVAAVEGGGIGISSNRMAREVDGPQSEGGDVSDEASRLEVQMGDEISTSRGELERGAALEASTSGSGMPIPLPPPLLPQRRGSSNVNRNTSCAATIRKNNARRVRQVAVLLCSYGIDTQAKDKNGMTAMDWVRLGMRTLSSLSSSSSAGRGGDGNDAEDGLKRLVAAAFPSVAVLEVATEVLSAFEGEVRLEILSDLVLGYKRDSSGAWITNRLCSETKRKNIYEVCRKELEGHERRGISLAKSAENDSEFRGMEDKETVNGVPVVSPVIRWEGRAPVRSPDNRESPLASRRPPSSAVCQEYMLPITPQRMRDVEEGFIGLRAPKMDSGIDPYHYSNYAEDAASSTVVCNGGHPSYPYMACEDGAFGGSTSSEAKQGAAPRDSAVLSYEDNGNGGKKNSSPPEYYSARFLSLLTKLQSPSLLYHEAVMPTWEFLGCFPGSMPFERVSRAQQLAKEVEQELECENGN